MMTKTLAIGMITLVGVLPLNSQPANAGTKPHQLSTPKTKTVTADKIQVTWAKQKKAHRYQVQINTKNSFTKTKINNVYTNKWTKSATQKTAYYIRYRVVTKVKNKDKYGSWSKTLKTTTKPKTPSDFKAKTSKAKNGALITWNKSTHATKYKIVVANNRGLNKEAKTYWTKNTKITVPLNSRDGQVRFAKVYAYNGTAQKHAQTITIFPQSNPVAKGEKIKIITQNVLCSGCTVNGVNPNTITWNKRAPIHLNKIKTQNPDIILLQEAWNPNNTLNNFYQQLETMGYTDGNPVKTGNGKSNRVLYKTSKYNKVSTGETKLPNGRAMTWMLLKSKTTGKQFYAVSAHTANIATQKTKTESAETINKQLNSLNKTKLSIFVGGDMNSSPFESTHTSHSTFIKNGWTDSASAVTAKGNQYETHNVMTTNKLKADYSRIDYIYSKNTGGWTHYENVLKIVKGKVSDKQASDHSMITGTATIK